MTKLVLHVGMLRLEERFLPSVEMTEHVTIVISSSRSGREILLVLVSELSQQIQCCGRKLSTWARRHQPIRLQKLNHQFVEAGGILDVAGVAGLGQNFVHRARNQRR